MLDSSNLPSPTQAELNSLYGAWNPMSYMQGQINQDLASQFRDQAYKANANSLDEQELKNKQSAALNPLLVEAQDLTNQGTGLTNAGRTITNQSSAIDLAHKQELSPEQLNLAREKIRTELGDQKFTQLSNNILKDHLANIASGDMEKINQTADLLQFIGGPTASKVSDRVTQAATADKNRLAENYRAQLGAETQTSTAQTHATSSENVANIQATERLKAAELKQSIANKAMAKIEAMNIPEAEKVRMLVELGVRLTPQYGTSVDLPALQNGDLRRNADRSNVLGNPPLSDDDLLNKYK